MDFRIKQAALLKLAQVKLAANHVLRQRAMKKQAKEVRLRVKRTPEQLEELKTLANAKPLPIGRLLNTLALAGSGGTLGLATGGPVGAAIGAGIGGIGGYGLGALEDNYVNKKFKEGIQRALDATDAEGYVDETVTPEQIEAIRKELASRSGLFGPSPIDRAYAQQVLDAYDAQVK